MLCVWIVFSFFGISFGCNKNEFPCEDGKQCINKNSWCNDKLDCSDESDEVYCDGKIECNPNMYFMCEEGPCIPVIGKCDGSYDCKDMSDESICGTQLRRAVHWLLQQRGADYGWGENTHRAMTALYLVQPFNKHNTSDMLMSKNLDIQLASSLERIQPSDLALYINALLVTCRDPRNFYGFDLVSLLRHQAGSWSHPMVLLTLCMVNSSSLQDERWLQRHLSSNSLDMKALAILAGTCLKQVTLNEGMKMIRDIENNGYPGNVDEASLVILALDELLLESWNRSNILNFILQEQTENGDFGSLLATYHAIQVLSGKSLSCEKFVTDPLEVVKHTRSLKIKYAVRFPSSVVEEYILKMKVYEGINFLTIMCLAQDDNDIYRFKIDKNRIYSIGGVPNDVEKGLRWKLYVNQRHFEGDISKLIAHDADEFLFTP